jgi:membrane-associated phospholipid phosphatase
MADGIEAIKEKAAVVIVAVKKQVHTWRGMIAAAGAIVSKPWRKYRANVFLVYLIGAMVVFLILAVLASTVAYFTFDVTITRLVQTFNPGWFNALMVALSWIGFAPQAYVFTLIILLFLIASGLKWETVVALISVIGSSALGLGIKVLIDRPRPSADLVNVFNQLSDFSFPSGHVLFFTVFFGFLIFLTYTLLKTSWWRTLILIVLVAVVALMGVSRVYLGQHWVSDVTAAYLLGSVWLTLTILVYRWGKPRFFVNQPVTEEIDGAP